MKLSNLSYLLLAVVLAATVGLFILFMPEEPSAIFYFNMGLTLLLESALFASGFIAAGKSQFTVQGIAIARQIARYAVFMLIAMGVFAVIGVTEDNSRWYYASLVVITVIFSVLTVVTYQGASIQKQTQQEQVTNTDSRRELGRSLSRCAAMFSSTANTATSTEAAAARKALAAATQRASFIKAKAFSADPDAIRKIEAAISELGRTISDMAAAEDAECVKAQCRIIAEKASAISRMIDMSNQI